MKNNAIVAVTWMLACVPALVLAGGFQISEHSARSTGMGGATVALVGDPSTISDNPAAISFLEGSNFSFGTTVMVPDEQFTGVSPDRIVTKMQPQVLFPPNVYLCFSSSHGFGAGISVNVPYDVQTGWDEGWVGARLATKSDMRVLMVTPALSMKPSGTLALGAGLCLGIPRILYEQQLAVPGVPGPDAVSTLDASGNVSYGFQAGVLFRPDNAWSFGASFRSRMDLNLEDGRVRYRNVPLSVADRYQEGRFSGKVPLPAQFQAGLSYSPTWWLVTAADIQYGLWSEFTTVDITFSNPVGSSLSLNENWRNTLNARFGLEINLSEISIRGGIRFERSPIPDDVLIPGLPDADGVGYALGFGYRLGHALTLDFAYQLMQYKDRSVSNSILVYDAAGGMFNGMYSSRTSSIALNVRYFWR